jgi:hypothetical protein
MPSDITLLAWIEPNSHAEFRASFVSKAAQRRQPATKRCVSTKDARQWVEDQAAALGVRVEWVDHNRDRGSVRNGDLPETR